MTGLVGRRVLVGITFVDEDGNLVEQRQVHGTVAEVDDEAIVLALPSRERFGLPPDPDMFEPAEPGSYRLRSTGEVVDDPDFVATWWVEAARGATALPRHGYVPPGA